MCRSAFEAWEADQAREDGPRGRCRAWGAPQNKRKFAKDLGDIFQGSLAPSALVTPWTGMRGARNRRLGIDERFQGHQFIPGGWCGAHGVGIVS